MANRPWLGGLLKLPELGDSDKIVRGSNYAQKRSILSLEGLKGIFYRLGVARPRLPYNLEMKEAPKIPTAPAGHQFPHQREEVDEAVREIHRKIEEAKSAYRPVV